MTHKLYTLNDHKAAQELTFRHPMAVTTAIAFQTGGVYPVCPQCGISMEREYQNFCDRCGQRLDWKNFDRVSVMSK